mmetsp:Transcript_33546/g.71906  ORF Transcript_33546/g.71906 Transcript_33546/m.71906 type:complete len:215 (+) Transcript_33546:242-886(+)
MESSSWGHLSLSCSPAAGQSHWRRLAASQSAFGQAALGPARSPPPRSCWRRCPKHRWLRATWRLLTETARRSPRARQCCSRERAGESRGWRTLVSHIPTRPLVVANVGCPGGARQLRTGRVRSFAGPPAALPPISSTIEPFGCGQPCHRPASYVFLPARASWISAAGAAEVSTGSGSGSGSCWPRRRGSRCDAGTARWRGAWTGSARAARCGGR